MDKNKDILLKYKESLESNMSIFENKESKQFIKKIIKESYVPKEKLKMPMNI